MEPALCNDGIPCTVDTCNTDGTCSRQYMHNVCDDNVLCTGVEQCTDFGCVSGAPPPGCCTSNGQCDNGDVCDGQETCNVSSRTCMLGTALNCDDSVACTRDSCDPVNGCAHQATDALCSDNQVCTGVETCNATTGCVPGTPPASCCRTDADCSNNNVCDGVETCDAATGACVPGSAPNCDDGVGCTVDSCDALAGCSSAPDDTACVDNSVCNGDERCDPVLDCVPGMPPAGCCTRDLDCDNTLACDGAETCIMATGTCLPGLPLVCGDADACTVDSCSESAAVPGCVHDVLPAGAVVTLTGVPTSGASSVPVTPAFTVDRPVTSAVLSVRRLEGGRDADGGVSPWGPYTGGPIGETGRYEAVVDVVECGGAVQRESATFRVDVTAPTLTATASPPANAAGWHSVAPTVTFAASDESGPVASVTPPVVVAVQGVDQAITGTATDLAGNTSSATLVVNTDFTPPVVTLTQPNGFIVVTDQSSITLAGAFGDDALSGFSRGIITSSRVSDRMTATAPGPFNLVMPLREGSNTITLSASDVAGAISVVTLTVYRDTTPPYVFIQSPVNGYRTTDATIDVSGLAQDLVIGLVQGSEVSVSVNGVMGTVSNGQFLVQGVPLVDGENTLTVTAVDRQGLVATHSVNVTRLLGTYRRLVKVSGDFQSCTVGAPLPLPVVVRLLDENDLPVVGEDVALAITDNDGTLASPASRLDSPVGHAVIVPTDTNGEAAANLTCGTRAGEGINRVTASAPGVLSSVSFLASGRPRPGINLYLHLGDGQTGEADVPLPIPLSVHVTDDMGNPVRNVDVRFTVTRGADGKVGGLSSITLPTDDKGVAEVSFTPGNIVGHGAYVVKATLAGSMAGSTTALGVMFNLSTQRPGPAESTTVSGTIVDQDEKPIRGITIRFPEVPEMPEGVQTDEMGRFEFPGAPVGHAFMQIDSSTASLPGGPIYPSMTMEVHNVAGAENRMDRPIFLLQLNNPVWVDGLSDVDLTLPEAPGFKLSIPAGTEVTFPDGSHEGWVSVTQVHADQAPMAPIDGLTSNLLVTIQPVGVRFNPPAPLTMPNVDTAPPLSKVTMFSFDHDIEAFIPIGPGSVSADGTVVKSDPGVGVVKGGWHCGPPPPPGGGGGSNCSVSLSAGAIADGEGVATATGSPGDEGGLIIGQSCGNLGISYGVCNAATCVANLRASSPSGRAVLVASKVGCSETMEELVTWCEDPGVTQTFSWTVGDSFARPFMKAKAVVEKVCKTDIGGEITGKYENKETCCPECPGMLATDVTKALSGRLFAEVDCSVGVNNSPVMMVITGVLYLIGVDVETPAVFGTGTLEATAGGSATTSACPDETNGTLTFGGAGSVKAGLRARLSFRGSLVGEAWAGASVGVELEKSLTYNQTTRKECDKVCYGEVKAEASVTYDLNQFVKILPGKGSYSITKSLWPPGGSKDCVETTWRKRPKPPCPTPGCRPSTGSSSSSGGGGGGDGEVFTTEPCQGPVPPPAADECDSDADCDTPDQPSCVVVPCVADKCQAKQLKPGTCLINNTCYAPGDAVGPSGVDENCLICDPSVNQYAGTPRPGWRCGGCGECNAGGACEANDVFCNRCQRCDVNEKSCVSADRGQDPRDECAPTSPECGIPGYCDGAGSCLEDPTYEGRSCGTNRVCRSGTCMDGSSSSSSGSSASSASASASAAASGSGAGASGGSGGGSGGGGAGASGGGGSSGGGGGGGSTSGGYVGCNTLLPGPTVTGTLVDASPPAMTGGTIQPGTYRLTSVTTFTGPGGATGAGSTWAARLSITGSRMDSVRVIGGNLLNSTDVIAPAGNQLNRTESCPLPGRVRPGTYSAQGSTLEIFADSLFVYVKEP